VDNGFFLEVFASEDFPTLIKYLFHMYINMYIF